MSVLLLVRHGQASFGTHDYDRLSPRGRKQARALGAELERRGIHPTLIVTGRMRRQRDTAQEAIDAASWTASVGVDGGWDEFDAAGLLTADAADDTNALTDTHEYQRRLEHASYRWASGEHDGDYGETFRDFKGRVDAALDGVLSELGSGQTAVVVSSAGAIAWAVARLIDGDFPQWLALNRVAVNSGVTKIVRGGSGTSLIGYNEHCHLAPDEVTYR